jgi:Tfp pilus assembly protein PilF
MLMATGSNDPNLEELLQIGIQTARKGNKPSARVIFRQILEADQGNERAWIWMASIAETLEERSRYLNAVLRINPDNQTALRELAKMQRKASSNMQVIRYGLIGLLVLLVLIALAFALVSVA